MLDVMVHIFQKVLTGKFECIIQNKKQLESFPITSIHCNRIHDTTEFLNLNNMS